MAIVLGGKIFYPSVKNGGWAFVRTPKFDSKGHVIKSHALIFLTIIKLLRFRVGWLELPKLVLIMYLLRYLFQRLLTSVVSAVCLNSSKE